MPIVSPFLGLRIINGITPVLILYNGLGVITLGSTFGTLDSGFSTADQPVNRAIYFVGNNIYGTTSSAGAIYAAVGASIYRSLDGGNSWVVATAITSISASTSFKSGLNIVTGADGLQYMCIVYTASDGSSIRAMRTTDGFTWISDGPILSNGFGAVSYSNDTVYGNSLYVIAPDGVTGGGVVCYQPTLGRLNYVLGIGAAETLFRAAMCVWDNNIYLAGYNTTTGARPLYKIEGGRLVQAVNLATSGTTATTTNKLGMFADASALYVFSLQVASSTGWACYQIDTPGTYTVTNITSTVITGNMAGTGPGTSSRVLTFVDGNYAPGANPPKYVMYSADGTAGTSFELFQWNGANAGMTSLGTGGDVSHALTLSKQINSNGIYDPQGIYPYIISSGPTTSGTVGWRINITLWGPIGNVTSIRLWYGNFSEEYPMQVGTLADPSSGSLGVNNTSITGLTVDDGFTTYSFTWVPPPDIADTANSRFSFSVQPF